MLHHVSVGVADVERSARFYDLVMAALGYKRVMEFLPHAVAYGETMPELWIGQPHDQGQPSAGNGIHIAFSARNERAVHAFHEAALAAGGSDEGGPGPRPEYSPGYYGAFVRDPDGNKLEAMLMVGQLVETPARRTAKRGAAAKRGKGAKRASARKAGARTAKARKGGKAVARKGAARRPGGRAGRGGRARKR